MKMTDNILITGSDQSDRNNFAGILKEGFAARGIKAAIIKLDPNSPKEGRKSVGYEVSLHFQVVVIFGCLDTKKDEARYKRIARSNGNSKTFRHIKISNN
jgi:hypothetical protein